MNRERPSITGPTASDQGRRLRVLQVLPDFSVAGAQVMACHLMSHLDPGRFHVGAVSLSARSDTWLERQLDAAGFPVCYLGKRTGFDPRRMVQLDALIRRFQPDVVHTHLHALSYALPSLLLRCPRAAVHTLHTVDRCAALPRFFVRTMVRRGVTPVAVCRSVAESATRWFADRPVVTILNGIPLDAYVRSPVDRSYWVSRHRSSPAAVVFACVAGMRPEKNHALLIDAFLTAFSGGDGAGLLLVGDGPLRDGLMDQIGEGRSCPIAFLGQRADVRDILNVADVFVLASEREGAPLSVMEAMAMGKPVIATAVGGVPELVVHRATGLLVAPGSCSDLVRAMRLLANDSRMRRAMGRRARVHALANYSARRMASSYAALYTRLVLEE
ncbi:MAG: glycosyltransferase [Chloroflexota bacterium]